MKRWPKFLNTYKNKSQLFRLQTQALNKLVHNFQIIYKKIPMKKEF